uniref:Putative lipocalin n=1 Tax=Rhipicephalus microplus TaxID=6941 RepID=A0A6G5A6R9_RHIMP
MLRSLLAAIALAVSQSAGEVAFRRTKVTGSVTIQEYYDTNETSWTYNTTKRTIHLCVGDTTYNITDKNVTYIRHSKQGHSEVNATLTGKFLHKSKHQNKHRSHTGDLYNAMDVYEDGEYWWTETLEYMSSDGKCGVFTVMVPLGKNRTRKSYDIRLKNSAVESDPDEPCRNKFDSLRRGSKVTTLYSPNCKKIVREAAK